jgi:hypothetical protein
MSDLQKLNDWRATAAPSTRKALMLLASLYKATKPFLKDKLLTYETEKSFDLALMSGFLTLDEDGDIVFISEEVRACLLVSVPTSLCRELNLAAISYFGHVTDKELPDKERASLQWLDYQLRPGL